MSTMFMYMFSYVNVFGVPVPQPSSVSVYLRVRVKSTVYVNTRLLVPGSPVHRDRIIHPKQDGVHRRLQLTEPGVCGKSAAVRG